MINAWAGDERLQGRPPKRLRQDELAQPALMGPIVRREGPP